MVVKTGAGKFVADDLREIPESPISALSRKAKQYKDAISLGRGEPDFDMADFMKDAFIRAVKDNETHYAAAGSIPGLNESIATKLKKENGFEVEPTFGVVVGAGSSAVLGSIFGAMFNPGEELIMMDPTYLMYISLARAMHIKPAFVPVFEQNNFAPTYEELKKVHNKKVKAILVNSPTNPTGGVYTKKQMEEIAKFAVDKDILIVSDEIYEYILYDGLKHISMASLGPEIAERTITVNGFSKSYAMTGLRVGYAAGDPKIMKYVYNHHYFGHICTCVPSMYAALEGLTNPKTKKFVADQVVEYDRRRKFIVRRLNEIGFETKTPKGAFYAFAHCSAFDKDSYRCVNNILDKAHVVAIPGSAFGPHGEGFIRFSYATAYDQIEEAMDRMGKTFKK